MIEFLSVHTFDNNDYKFSEFTEPNQSLTVREILQQYSQGFVSSHENHETDLYNTDNFSDDELLDRDLIEPEDKGDLIEFANRFASSRIIENERQKRVHTSQEVEQPQKTDDPENVV